MQNRKREPIKLPEDDAAIQTLLFTGRVTAAYSEGDCFFDALAQCLEYASIAVPEKTWQRKGGELVLSNPPLHKKLRLVCDKYVKERQKNGSKEWLEKAIQEDHVEELEPYLNEYLLKVQFTQPEIEKEEAIPEAKRIAIWGRPWIEGRLLCEVLGIQIHCISIEEKLDNNGHRHAHHQLVTPQGVESSSAEAINDTSLTTIHVVTYMRHFVPLLPHALSKCRAKALGFRNSEKGDFKMEASRDKSAAKVEDKKRELKEQKEAENFDLTAPGHVPQLKLGHSFNNLEADDVPLWEAIPMFAVVSGKNGIGKTNLLRILAEKGADSLSEGKPDIHYLFSFLDQISPIDAANMQSSTKGYDLEMHKIYEKFIEYFLKKEESFEDDFFEEVIYSVIEEKSDLYKDVEKFKKQNPIKISNYRSILKAFTEQFEKFLSHHFKRIFMKRNGLHPAVYLNLTYYINALIVSGIELEAINISLKDAGFKYSINIEENSPDPSERGKFRFSFSDHTENGKRIQPMAISPGERLELFRLLWTLEVPGIARPKINVMLLDEPDAHLHPSLAKEFIETIQTRLVKHYGIQVIMTTHSPTTVSMVPKENLFIMDRDEKSHKIKVRRAHSKLDALQLLNSDFVYVKEPLRIVFVEAPDDVRFYNMTKHQLIHRGVLSGDIQPYFKAHGQKRKDGSDQEDSSSDRVKRFVRSCVLVDDHPEENKRDNDITLKEFIFGLVDGDNQTEQDAKENNSNIKVLKRYSIENYIFDPVHLFYALMWNKTQSDWFKKIYCAVQEEINSKALSLPLSVKGLISCAETEPEKARQVMQIILNVVSREFIQTINEEISKIEQHKKRFLEIQEALRKEPGNKALKKEKDVLEEMIEAIETLGKDRFKLIQNGKILESKKSSIPVEITSRISLVYPAILIKMRGHDLEFAYHLFEKKNSVSKRMMFSFFEKDCMFPFLDLIEIFESFGRSSALAPLQLERERKEEIKSRASGEIEEKDREIEQLKKKNANLNRDMEALQKKKREVESKLHAQNMRNQMISREYREYREIKNSRTEQGQDACLGSNVGSPSQQEHKLRPQPARAMVRSASCPHFFKGGPVTLGETVEPLFPPLPRGWEKF